MLAKAGVDLLQSDEIVAKSQRLIPFCSQVVTRQHTTKNHFHSMVKTGYQICKFLVNQQLRPDLPAHAMLPYLAPLPDLAVGTKKIRVCLAAKLLHDCALARQFAYRLAMATP
jgi:hypothetical protein